MKKSLALLLLVAFAAPAWAADLPKSPEPIKVELTRDEITAALQLFDQAVRANGLKSAGNAVFLQGKFDAALKAAEKGKPDAK